MGIELSPPFIVYALPRSRTAWIAKFLTYGDWTCHHERAIYMHDLTEAIAFLSQPHTGSAETAAHPGWWLIHHHIPNIKAVVIRRPVEDVVASFMRLEVPGFTYDEDKLRRGLLYGDRVLDRVSKQPNVLTLQHTDLDHEAGVTALFEHCLPHKFDRQHWIELRHQNIQADVGAILRYASNYKTQIDGFKSSAKAELRRLKKRGELNAVL